MNYCLNSIIEYLAESVIVSFVQLLFTTLNNLLPITLASSGGKALPTCVPRLIIGPTKMCSSGNVWIRATSLIVSVLCNIGWIGKALCPGTMVVDGLEISSLKKT